jgi:hypothetical protein
VPTEISGTEGFICLKRSKTHFIDHIAHALERTAGNRCFFQKNPVFQKPKDLQRLAQWSYLLPDRCSVSVFSVKRIF